MFHNNYGIYIGAIESTLILGAYEAAKTRHPERWNGRATRNWENITEVYLNPDRKYEETPVLSGNSLEAAAS